MNRDDSGTAIGVTHHQIRGPIAIKICDSTSARPCRAILQSTGHLTTTAEGEGHLTSVFQIQERIATTGGLHRNLLLWL